MHEMLKWKYAIYSTHVRIVVYYVSSPAGQAAARFDRKNVRNACAR